MEAKRAVALKRASSTAIAAAPFMLALIGAVISNAGVAAAQGLAGETKTPETATEIEPESSAEVSLDAAPSEGRSERAPSDATAEEALTRASRDPQAAGATESGGDLERPSEQGALIGRALAYGGFAAGTLFLTDLILWASVPITGGAWAYTFRYLVVGSGVVAWSGLLLVPPLSAWATSKSHSERSPGVPMARAIGWSTWGLGMAVIAVNGLIGAARLSIAYVFQETVAFLGLGVVPGLFLFSTIAFAVDAMTTLAQLRRTSQRRGSPADDTQAFRWMPTVGAAPDLAGRLSPTLSIVARF